MKIVASASNERAYADYFRTIFDFFTEFHKSKNEEKILKNTADFIKKNSNKQIIQYDYLPAGHETDTTFISPFWSDFMDKVEQKYNNMYNDPFEKYYKVLENNKPYQKKNKAISIGIKIHYIFLIDDSGSMAIEKWENAKNCLQNLKAIMSSTASKKSRMSIIQFNDNSRVVLNRQPITPDLPPMPYNGGRSY